MDDEKLQVAFQTRMGEQVVRMTSTLVETVSINYEGGTCLCMYDGSEHTPKLLQCSHTVCLQCLTRIVATAALLPIYSAASLSSPSTVTNGTSTTPRDQQPQTFRCPICRELIKVPTGGVGALPPSFLVNQLLDLMASQRREVIPKCSTHSNQELLFCETCDSVFCAACVTSPHTSSIQSNTSGDHTVIPFSIAVKRMSEILLYKAKECLTKLDEAGDCVSDEIQRLDVAADTACNVVNKTYEDAARLLEKQKNNYIAKIREVSASKKEKLKEQLELIDKERSKVRETCDEIRHVTKKISELSSQLDSFLSLRHPRENAYIICKTQSDLLSLETSISTEIHTSNTFPPLCTLKTEPGSLLCAGLEVEVILETRDYHNQARKEGGDPIKIQVQTPKSVNLSENQVVLEDNEDGTYSIKFTPFEVGQYSVHVEIFGRPVKDEFKLEIGQHNNPVKTWGRGSGESCGDLCQPVSVSKGDNGELYVLDTGIARVVVLDQSMSLNRVVENDALKGRSCTGVAYCNQTNSLLVVNWRSKQVTRMSPLDGKTQSSFTHTGFVEPVGISVDRKGNVYVADNGARSIFIFDVEGKSKNVIKRDTFGLLGGVAVAPDDSTVVVADMSLFIVNSNKATSSQQFDREIKVEGKGRFGGVVVDQDGVIIATRTEKSRSFIQVFKDNKLVSTIDSFNSKLKRPTDLVPISNSRNVLVVDLGNDCVKVYRYK